MKGACQIDFLVEEPSMRIALETLVPRICPDVTFHIFTYQCKQQLLTRLPHRLQGYAARLEATPELRIMILVDRDNDDCYALKAHLEHIARQAGLAPSGKPDTSGARRVFNRIVIEELEAWYFGDWEAVRAAYPRVSATVPARAGLRNPDAIRGGTWEVFERTLQKAGYCKGGLRKIETARTITTHMDPDRNRSKSFQVFRNTLRMLTNP